MHRFLVIVTLQSWAVDIDSVMVVIVNNFYTWSDCNNHLHAEQSPHMNCNEEHMEQNRTQFDRQDREQHLCDISSHALPMPAPL